MRDIHSPPKSALGRIAFCYPPPPPHFQLHSFHIVRARAPPTHFLPSSPLYNWTMTTLFPALKETHPVRVSSHEMSMRFSNCNNEGK